MMKNDTFNELLESIQQGGKILRKKKGDTTKEYESTIHYFERNDLGEELSVVKPVLSSAKISKRKFIVTLKNPRQKKSTRQ
jgi:hypothetical protein